MKYKVCMLVMNDVISDPRVTKEAQALTEKGWDVVVIGVNKFDRQEYSHQGDFEILRGDMTFWGRWYHGVGKMIFKIVSMLKIGRLALKQKPFAFHAHDFEMLPVAFLASRVKRCKLVYDSHELWVEQKADFPKALKWLVRKIEGFLIRKSDLVITVNASIAEELQKRYGLVHKPAVLHNFTSLSPLQLAQFKDKEKIVVLYHGGYLKDRGLPQLIQAARLLPAHIVIHFRGMGPLEKELQQMANDLIHQGKIAFYPPVPMSDLVKSAQTADIGIIPYQPTCLNNYYSLPNKLSEYAMAGLAVCASDLPEISNINNQVRFGHLFDPNSPASIANAIIMTSENLQEYKSNARRWAESTGNWEHEKKKLGQHYKNLLEDSRG